MAVPELVVFDLDECLYSPEMYTLEHVPCEPVHGDLGGGHGEGVVGVRSGPSVVVSLYPHARRVLQEIHAQRHTTYAGMRLAAASSADTPFAARCGRACLATLEVVPGVTVEEMLAHGHDDSGEHLQIGRTGRLSADKVTHFTLIRAGTGIAFEGMLFFDDCNWSDNCARVERGCPGVVTQKTPHGLGPTEWEEALLKYAEARAR